MDRNQRNGLIFGVIFGISVVLVTVVIVTVLLLSRHFKIHGKDQPDTTLLPMHVIDHSDRQYYGSTTISEVFADDHSSVGNHNDLVTYNEGAIEDAEKDAKMEEIERIIQNMGQ